VVLGSLIGGKGGGCGKSRHFPNFFNKNEAS